MWSALVLVVSVHSVPLLAQTAVAAAEHEVFEAVLDSLFAGEDRSSFVVADTTRGSLVLGDVDLVMNAMGEMQRVSPELRASYVERNRSPGLLGSGATPASAAPQPFDDWNTPRLRNVRFSRVGFDPNGSEALVHVLYDCGPICGGGYLIRLNRAAGRWMIVEVVASLVV